MWLLLAYSYCKHHWGPHSGSAARTRSRAFVPSGFPLLCCGLHLSVRARRCVDIAVVGLRALPRPFCLSALHTGRWQQEPICSWSCWLCVASVQHTLQAAAMKLQVQCNCGDYPTGLTTWTQVSFCTAVTYLVAVRMQHCYAH